MSDDESQETVDFQRESWYTDASQYWSAIPATINGMLGGFGRVAHLDADSSARFLQEFTKGKLGADNRVIKPPRLGTSYALDCGAGIGRVTKQLLLRYFDKVDLVEPTPRFLEHAERIYLASEKRRSRIGRFFCSGLQDFSPAPGLYDLVWCQWVLCYLTDEDLIAFLRRCAAALREGGLICIKENVTVLGYTTDEQDSSVTRSDQVFKKIFDKAGLRLLKEDNQHGFPEELFAVKMYALESDTCLSNTESEDKVGPNS